MVTKNRKYGNGSIVVQKRNGKKYYVAKFIVGKDVNGVPTYKTRASYSYDEVLEKMEKAKEEYRNKNIVYEKGALFGEAYKTWIFTFKKEQVTSTTFLKYFNTYELRLKDFDIAKVPLGEITSTMLQNHFNNLSDKYSSKTLYTSLMHIKTFFKYCTDDNKLGYNPSKSVKIFRKKEKEFNDAYSIQEQIQILKSLDYTSGVDIAIFLGLKSGLRLGELLALTWEDYKDGTLNVNKQYNLNINILPDGTRERKYEVLPLKTNKSYREVPLDDETNKILNKYKVSQAEILLKIGKLQKPEQLICCNECGDYLYRQKPTKRLVKLCKELNIEYKTFHKLRHSYISNLNAAHIDPKMAQELAGHEDITTTLNIYTHVNLKQKKTAVNKVNLLELMSE